MAEPYVDQVYLNTLPDQFQNLWEFEIEGNEDMKFKVVSSSLPFTKLVTESRKTGEKYYSGIEYPGPFTIQVREDTSFSVYDYFKGWQDGIVNENREFVSLDENVEIGSNDDTIHKTGYLKFFTFENDAKNNVEYVQKEVERRMTTVFQNIREVDRPDITKIIRQEIINNLFLAGIRRTVRRLTDVGSSVQSTANLIGLKGVVPSWSRSGSKPKLPTRKDYLFAKSKADFRSERIRFKTGVTQEQKDQAVRITQKTINALGIQKLKEKQGKIFKFTHMKILGIDEVSLSYESGDPLIYSISLVADYIEEG